MKTQSKDETRPIAIDVTDLRDDRRGEKTFNALMSANGMLYQTKRGRLAIQIRPESFQRLKAQLKLDLVEGLDGTKILVFLANPKEASHG